MLYIYIYIYIYILYIYKWRNINTSEILLDCAFGLMYVWVPLAALLVNFLGKNLFLNGKAMFIFEISWFATSINFG